MTSSINPDDLAKVEPWLREPFFNFGPGHETRVAVRDLERAKRFYVDKLNASVVSESETEIKIEIGPRRIRQTLKLACRGEWPEKIRFPFMVNIFFVGGTHALYEHFERIGVTVKDAFREDEDGRGEFTITDPDGNWLTFKGPS